MIIQVSISELRNNIAAYLEKVTGGDRVVIRDEKKDETVAQIIKISSFDKNLYEKTLRKAAGVLSAQNHSEWNTKAKVIRWVNDSRLADDRAF